MYVREPTFCAPEVSQQASTANYQRYASKLTQVRAVEAQDREEPPEHLALDRPRVVLEREDQVVERREAVARLHDLVHTHERQHLETRVDADGLEHRRQSIRVVDIHVELRVVLADGKQLAIERRPR